MKALALILTLSFLATAPNLFADPPRSDLHAVPSICGKQVKEYNLVAPVIVDDSRFGGYVQDNIVIRMTPGRFIPISEDSEGVFFQSLNGVAHLKFPRQGNGGVYVSKTRPNRMRAYVGNAQAGSKEGVRKDIRNLKADEMSLFHSS